MLKTTENNWSMDGDEFKVLINDEGQHSLWPSAQPIPEGWEQVGPIGLKPDCLSWIKDNWTDIAPKSLRAALH